MKLSQALGLKMLGEGIEERSQLRHLQREDCDLGRRFLLARPVEAEAIERLLGGGLSRGGLSAAPRLAPRARAGGMRSPMGLRRRRSRRLEAGQNQLDMGSAPTHRVAGPHLAAVGLRDRAHDRQPQSRAAGGACA